MVSIVNNIVEFVGFGVIVFLIGMTALSMFLNMLSPKENIQPLEIRALYFVAFVYMADTLVSFWNWYPG